MGKSYRADRLGGEIQKVVGELLINGVKDPRLTSNFVNITGVEVTPDGSYAYIYVTVLGFSKDPEVVKGQQEEVLRGLNSAKGLFKKELAKAVQIRRIPELIFKFDQAAAYGEHIDEILSTIPFEEYHAEDHSAVTDSAEDEEEL